MIVQPRFRDFALAALLAVALLAGPTRAGATTVSLNPDRDNTLYESTTGSLSSGAGPAFYVGRTNQPANSIRRGLLRFDVAGAVPAGATITAVTLRVTVSATTAAATDAGLHRVTADWGEGASNAEALGTGGGGAPAQAGDATWRHRFFSATLWGSLGGTFAAAASATTALDVPGDYTWASTPALVADVQGWLDLPANNFGWLIRGDETTQPTSKKIESRESATPEFRPLLTVEFTQPVPAESATWGRIKAAYR